MGKFLTVRRLEEAAISSATGSTPRRIGRRGLLGGAAALAAGLGVGGLAGCAIDTSTGVAGPTRPPFAFPDYGVDPGRGTVRWLDSGDLKSVYEKAVLTAFADRHGPIETDYQGTGWETIRQVLSLGIRNGTAPDVFALPPDILPQTAISQGWVRPVDDVIPDLAGWRRNWPSTGLIPGVHTFDGRLYSFPLNSSRRLDRMLFFDTANLRAAGYDDPARQIRTWDDVHTGLTRVVRAGHTGLMIGRDGLASTVAALATSVGWRGSLGGWSGMDMGTGRYAYDADEVVTAFEFLQRLVRDKLVVPGYLTLTDKDARSQFSAGRCGMMFVGAFSLPAWKAQAPQWQKVPAPLPSQDGSAYLVPFAETGANNVWLYAGSRLGSAVGQLFAFMGSPEGQKWMVVLSQGNLVSLQPAANRAAAEAARLDPQARYCSELAQQIMRSCPQVELRNAETARSITAVKLRLQPVTPIWQDLMQGLFTGDLTDPRATFRRYNDALEQALERALASAAAEGSTVTRDDFAFPNWDPRRDYTSADYEEL